MPLQQIHGLATPTESIPSAKATEGYFEPSYEQNKTSSSNLTKRHDVKLQFSNLMDSLRAAAIIDEQGFWNGQEEDENLRLELQNMCLKLQQMISSPIDVIQNIAQGHHLQAALRYAVRNNLPQCVPVSNTITYHDLAAQASVDETQCKRIMRLLTSNSIFSELSPGTVCHTPASMALLDSDIQAWVEYTTSDSVRSSMYLSDALQKWPASQSPAETAYTLANNTSAPMFEHFEQIPGKLDRFRKAMIAMAKQPAVGVGHVIKGYPWHSLSPTASVIDVGGGRGHVASAISAMIPSLQVTVQDIGVIQPHSEGVISFSRYDFFESQPIKGADVYFLRQILHDWPHDFALRILRNQIDAMESHSKLVVVDIVMPQPGEWSLLEERRSRTTDVTMLTLFNSREREMADWLALVEEADSRLRLTHFARPTGSLFSVMEFSLCT